MRDKWYGDDRDLVKWTTLVHIAHTYNLRSILQVSYWRSEPGFPQILFSGNKVSVPQPVWKFFRDIRKAASLGNKIGISVNVIADEFKPQERAAYLRCVKKHITNATSPLLLFLDPDTGLQPKNAKAQHTTIEEVKELWKTLKPKDWLVLYQHARREVSWDKTIEDQFIRLCGGGRVKTARSEKIGRDVLLLCAEQPGRS